MSPGGRRVGQVVLLRQGYRWRNWAKVPDGATTGRVGLLAAAVALPMFAQCFQYMIDIPPLYFLDKAWPLLMLPLCLWAIVSLDIPYKPLYIVTLFWALGVTPYIGILRLGNDTLAALATTAKVWAYTSVFSAAGMLVLLRPRLGTVRRLLLGLGIGTYVLLVLLWLIVPRGAYGGGDAVSKLFMFDSERGYRIYMPMFFGTLLIFYLNRSFWIQPRVWKVAGLVLAFLLLVTMYKQRAAIAGAGASVLIGAVLGGGRWRPAILALVAVATAVGGLYIFEHVQQLTLVRQSLGGSLTTRQGAVATAWTYLSGDSSRWIFGVGATTRFGDVTLGRLFGNRAFFLTDIGWLGVVFEYGAIGAVLMLLMHLAGLRAAAIWSRPTDALSQAFVDYIVYLILVSPIYSVVFTPGELTTIMALSYYVNLARDTHRAGAARPAYRSDVVQSDRSMPRHIASASARPSGRLVLPGPSGTANRG